jgi:hypothetical protein
MMMSDNKCALLHPHEFAFEISYLFRVIDVIDPTIINPVDKPPDDQF